jgi:hypothetical protein
MDLIDFVVRSVVTFMIVRFIFDCLDSYAEKQHIKTQIEEHVADHIKNIKMFNCTCELHMGTVYLFDEDDNFVAQGRNIQEIKDHLEKRFKQYMINLTVTPDMPKWLRQEKAVSNGTN